MLKCLINSDPDDPCSTKGCDPNPFLTGWPYLFITVSLTLACVSLWLLAKGLQTFEALEDKYNGAPTDQQNRIAEELMRTYEEVRPLALPPPLHRRARVRAHTSAPLCLNTSTARRMAAQPCTEKGGF